MKQHSMRPSKSGHLRTRQSAITALFAVPALAIGCSASPTTDGDVETLTAALGTGYCDTTGQSRWAVYGQNLLGQRCVSSGDLPTATTAAGLEVQWNNPTGQTTSTPIVAYGHVFYGDQSSNFYSVDKETGELEWQVSLYTPGTFGGFDPIRGTAAVTQHHVYVATGHKLFKLDRNDGTVIWSHLMDPHWAVLIDSSPTPVGDKILIGVSGFELAINVPERTFRGSVVAIDAESGDEIWRTYTTNDDSGSGAGVSVWSSFTVDESLGLAYIGTGNTYEPPAAPLSDSILAVDIETGDIVWSHQFAAGDIFTQVPLGPGTDSDVGATPNLFTLDGQDVVGVGSKNGVYKIFDRATGSVIRGFQLHTALTIALMDPNIPDEAGTAYVGGIMGSAAVANETIYVNSNIWWTYQQVTQGTPNPMDTSVTYAVNASTGQILWARPMPAPHFGGLTKVNDVIYHTLTNGVLVGLNAADGSFALFEQLPAPAGGGVSAAGDQLYVAYGFTFSPFLPPVSASGVRAYALPE